MGRMRSGITRRWLRGNLLITVLLVLLAETMFLYNYTRSYYNSVQQTMYRRFSSVSGLSLIHIYRYPRYPFA